MIAFEVRLNGERVCIAGAEDLAVLNTIVSASGRLGPKTVPARSNDTKREVSYSIGGLTARADPEKDVHVRWKSLAPLKVGDLLQVKVVEVKKADRPKSRKRAARKYA
jgi:hypothetical protein